MGIIPSRDVNPVESLLCTLRSHASDVSSACHCMRNITWMVKDNTAHRRTLTNALLRKDYLGFQILFHSCCLMRNGDIKAHALQWCLFAIQESDSNAVLMVELDLIAVITDFYFFAISEPYRVPSWAFESAASLMCACSASNAHFMQIIFESNLHSALISRLKVGYTASPDEVQAIIGFLRPVRAPNLVSLLAKVKSVEVLLDLVSRPSMEQGTVEGILWIVNVIVRSFPPVTLPIQHMTNLIKLLFSPSGLAQSATMHILHLLLPDSITSVHSPLQATLIPVLRSPLGLSALSHLCVSETVNTEHFFKIAYFVLGQGDVCAFLRDLSHLQHVLMTMLSLQADAPEATLRFVLGALTHIAIHKEGSEALGASPATLRFVMTLLFNDHTTMAVCMASLRLLTIMCENAANQRRILNDRQFLSIVRVLRCHGNTDELRCTVVTLELIHYLIQEGGAIFAQCSEGTHIAILSTVCNILDTAPLPSVSLVQTLPTTITFRCLQVLHRSVTYPVLAYYVIRFLPLRKIRRLSLCPSTGVVKLVDSLLKKLHAIDPVTANDWRGLGVGCEALTAAIGVTLAKAFIEIIQYVDNKISDVSMTTTEHIISMQRGWRATAPSRQRDVQRCQVIVFYQTYITIRIETIEQEKCAFDKFLVVQEEHLHDLHLQMNARRQLSTSLEMQIQKCQEEHVEETLSIALQICSFSERCVRELETDMCDHLFVCLKELSKCSNMEVLLRQKIMNEVAVQYRQTSAQFSQFKDHAIRRTSGRIKVEGDQIAQRNQLYMEEFVSHGKLTTMWLQFAVVSQSSEDYMVLKDTEIDEYDRIMFSFFSSFLILIQKAETSARDHVVDTYMKWTVTTTTELASVNVSMMEQIARNELYLWEDEMSTKHRHRFIIEPLLYMNDLETMDRLKCERQIQRFWWRAVRHWPVSLVEAAEENARYKMNKEHFHFMSIIRLAESRLRTIALQVAEASRRAHIYNQYYVFSEHQQTHLAYTRLASAHMAGRNAIARDWFQRAVRIMQPIVVRRLREVAARLLKKELTQRANLWVDEILEHHMILMECLFTTEVLRRNAIDKEWRRGALARRARIENIVHVKQLREVSAAQPVIHMSAVFSETGTTKSVLFDTVNDCASTKRRPHSAGHRRISRGDPAGAGEGKGKGVPPEATVQKVKVWMDMYVA